MLVLKNEDEYKEFVTTVFIMAGAEKSDYLKKKKLFSSYLQNNLPNDFPVLVLISEEKNIPLLKDLTFITKKKIKQILDSAP